MSKIWEDDGKLLDSCYYYLRIKGGADGTGHDPNPDPNPNPNPDPDPDPDPNGWQLEELRQDLTLREDQFEVRVRVRVRVRIRVRVRVRLLRKVS